MPTSPTASPRYSEGESTAVRPSRQRQESTSGPSGQSTSGRKVEGQASPAGRSVEGQSTGVRHP